MSQSKWIRHAISVDMYANTIKELLEKELRKLFSEAESIIRHYGYISTKSKLKNVYSQIKLTTNKFETSVNEIIDDVVNSAIEIETDFLSKLNIVVPQITKNELFFIPIAQRDPTKFTKEIKERFLSNAKSALQTSYLFGESSAKTAKRLVLRESTEIQKTGTATKTLVTGIYRNIDYKVLQNEEVMYSAVLDSSTCLVCASLNGNIYQKGAHPILPMHDNCRCVLIPLSLKPTATKFPEWIETQDETTKEEILGKVRYKLYKNGIKITDFVDNGKKITIKELVKR